MLGRSTFAECNSVDAFISEYMCVTVSVCPSVYTFLCLHQHFLRPVVEEVTSVRSNLLAWRCRIWYFLRLWPNFTWCLIQHPSLIPSIPCIPFLYSQSYCHPFSSQCTGHLVATPPSSPLCVSQPQQQLGSTCSWSALFALFGCDRKPWPQPDSLSRVSCVSDWDVTQTLASFLKSTFNKRIIALLCSLISRLWFMVWIWVQFKTQGKTSAGHVLRWQSSGHLATLSWPCLYC